MQDYAQPCRTSSGKGRAVNAKQKFPFGMDQNIGRVIRFFAIRYKKMGRLKHKIH